MKLEVKIKPELLEEILKGKKGVEFRQVESIILTCNMLGECIRGSRENRLGPVCLHNCRAEFNVRHVCECSPALLRAVFQSVGVPYVEGLPGIMIDLGARKDGG